MEGRCCFAAPQQPIAANATQKAPKINTPLASIFGNGMNDVVAKENTPPKNAANPPSCDVGGRLL